MKEAAIGLWDGGSTLSFITFKLAGQLQLRGKPVKLEIVTVGGETKILDSLQYKASLIDQQGKPVEIEVLGIKKISTSISKVNSDELVKLFTVDQSKVKRPDGEEIEILIGMQYAAFHPVRRESSGHLLLLQNRFGYVIAGTHPSIKETTKVLVKHATVLHNVRNIDKFYTVESLGVTCQPRCGSCKCGKCHP